MLDGLDLEIESGEYIVMLGPSGCGKSTTLQIIAGLLHPDGGSLAFNGESVESVAPRARDVAMVFQHDGLYPHLTVEQSIRFALNGKFSNEEIQVRLQEAIELTNTSAILHRYPSGLSGGELRRAAMAKAIARRTSIRLLDEPLSALDTSVRHSLQEDILRWHSSVPGTTIHVTHDGQEAVRMADRIAVMDGGIVIQFASPSQVFRQPASLAVAEAIGSPPINLLDARSAHGNIEFDESSVTSSIKLDSEQPSRSVVVGIRPDAFRVTRPHESANSARGVRNEASDGGIVVTGTVLSSRWMQDGTLLHIRAGSHEIAAMIDHRSPSSDPRPHKLPSMGDSIRIVAGPEDIHLFDTETGKRIVD